MKTSQMNHKKVQERPSAGTSLFILGTIIGVSAMYVLDPQDGKRRRTFLRDKARRLRNFFNTYKPQGTMYKTRKTIQTTIDQADASW